MLRAMVLAGFAVLALPVLDRATAQLRNSDVFWQVRTGEMALRSGTFPDADPFSYTVFGTPWNNHEWGFELAAALLRRLGGWGALRALVLVLCGGTLTALAAVLHRRAGPGWALLVATFAFLFLGYKFIPAPQTVSMALLFFAFYWLRAARPFDSRRRTAALAGLLLLWGNLTAEALLFLPFLLLEEGTRIWERPAAPWRRLGALGLVCVAPLLNPPWSSTLEYFLSGTRINRNVNVEFRSFLEPAATVPALIKWLAIVLAAVYLVWAIVALAREPTPRRLRQVGPGLIAIAAAALAERNLWLLVLPVARLALELSRRDGRRQLQLAAAALSPLLIAAWLLGFGWTPAAERPLFSRGFWTSHIDRSAVPLDCAEHVAALGAGRHVFTLRVWASYFIWRLPADRVFIDGRNREYPESLFAAAVEVWNGGPQAQLILDQSGTDVVVAHRAWNEGPGLRGGPWRRTFLGPSCAVFERG